MSEVLRIGPYESYPRSGYPEGYHDSRALYDVTLEIVKYGGHDFNFHDALARLAAEFPSDETIEIFEGGCGYGYTLHDLKQIVASLGRNAITTGVTKHKIHVPRGNQQYGNPDHLIVGSVQKAYKKGHIGNDAFHFIFDNRGAMMYSEPHVIIPFYRDILKPNGKAFVHDWNLNLESNMYGSDTQRMYEKTAKVFSDNGLAMEKRIGPFALLRKA